MEVAEAVIIGKKHIALNSCNKMKSGRKIKLISAKRLGKNVQLNPKNRREEI